MRLFESERMSADLAERSKPGWQRRIGWSLSGLAILFLLMDGICKILKLAPVVEVCQQLEIPVAGIPGLGMLLTGLTLLYAWPRTAPLAALLLTGYLGGAIWTHVRMGGPVFPMVFPVLVGAILWGGLCLRDRQVRAVLLRRPF